MACLNTCLLFKCVWEMQTCGSQVLYFCDLYCRLVNVLVFSRLANCSSLSALTHDTIQQISLRCKSETLVVIPRVITTFEQRRSLPMNIASILWKVRCCHKQQITALTNNADNTYCGNSLIKLRVTIHPVRLAQRLYLLFIQ